MYYVRHPETGKEVLIPAIKQFVSEINLAEKRILVKLLPDLLIRGITLQIDILTIFPKMFESPFQESILKKAQEKGLLKINLIDIRSFSRDKHKKVDDYPFGGGVGMVMKPEPIFEAWEFVCASNPDLPTKTILLTPQGRTFSQAKAQELSKSKRLILICGHYEGIDERVREQLVDEEISIGDYVLTGGELPAMVLVDAVARLLPGVLGSEESALDDSFSDGLLEYPQYTKGWRCRRYFYPGITKKFVCGAENNHYYVQDKKELIY